MTTEKSLPEDGNVTGPSQEATKPEIFAYSKGPFLPSKKDTEAQMLEKIEKGDFDKEIAEAIAALQLSIQAQKKIVFMDLGIAAGDNVPECKFVAAVILTPDMLSVDGPIRQAVKDYLKKNHTDVTLTDKCYVDSKAGNKYVLLAVGGLSLLNLKQLRSTFEKFIEGYKKKDLPK